MGVDPEAQTGYCQPSEKVSLVSRQNCPAGIQKSLKMMLCCAVLCCATLFGTKAALQQRLQHQQHHKKDTLSLAQGNLLFAMSVGLGLALHLLISRQAGKRRLQTLLYTDVTNILIIPVIGAATTMTEGCITVLLRHGCCDSDYSFAGHDC